MYQDISDIGKFDLVINGLKAHSANNTAKHVSQLLHESSVILPTLNGILGGSSISLEEFTIIINYDQ